MPDPQVRDDGLCALDGCGKPRKPERSRRYAGDMADVDPFCSTECCRRFHNVKSRYTDDERPESDSRLEEAA